MMHYCATNYFDERKSDIFNAPQHAGVRAGGDKCHGGVRYPDSWYLVLPPLSNNSRIDTSNLSGDHFDFYDFLQLNCPIVWLALILATDP